MLCGSWQVRQSSRPWLSVKQRLHRRLGAWKRVAVGSPGVSSWPAGGPWHCPQRATTSAAVARPGWAMARSVRPGPWFATALTWLAPGP